MLKKKCKKKITFFSSQSSDDENLKILTNSLEKKYEIKKFYSTTFEKFKNEKRFKKNKEKFLLNKFKRIISNSNLIITGSAKHNYEKKLWKISKTLNVRTLCLVDSWVNLNVRFNKKNYPNFIIFPNDKVKLTLLNFLKKNSELSFLGQPYLEKISKINFKTKEENILFLSSRQNYIKDLKILREILNKYSKLKVILKIHQKDKSRKCFKDLKKRKIKNLIISSKHLNSLLLKTKYVFGVYTMGLLVSIIAKKTTFVALNSKNKKEYLHYLLKRYGYEINFKSPSIKKITKFRPKKFYSFSIYKNSTQKIIKLINDICNTN